MNGFGLSLDFKNEATRLVNTLVVIGNPFLCIFFSQMTIFASSSLLNTGKGPGHDLFLYFLLKRYCSVVLGIPKFFDAAHLCTMFRTNPIRQMDSIFQHTRTDLHYRSCLHQLCCRRFGFRSIRFLSYD